VKPACVSVREGTKPGGASLQAVLLNPEICIVVDNRITFKVPEEKPTYGRSGRQQSPERYGERTGHHRDLRAGHAYKGITRELERARCFHAKVPEGHRLNKAHGVGDALSFADERNQRASMVSQRHLKRSAARRASGSLSRS